MEATEKVCQFLKDRRIPEDVIEKFRTEKMDIAAIIHSSDNFLSEMGLTKAGDRLSLRGFCTTTAEETDKDENRQRKKNLLESFLQRKKVKSTTKHASQPEKLQKKKTRRIQLGWKHFKENEQAYVLVPLSKGGGSRVCDMALSSNRIDLMRQCKNLFFPDEISMFGHEEDMDFDLANFRGDHINVTIKVGNSELPFNLGNYIEAHKARVVRIYLRSKRKEASAVTKYLPTHILQSISDDGDEEPMPMLEDGLASTLIGTTAERQALLKNQNQAYEDSLKEDRAKCQERKDALEKQVREVEQKVKVCHARMARVPPEPTEDGVMIRLRHVVMGMQERMFPSSSTMSAAYDWAGSLSTDPENFTLCDPTGAYLPPDSELTDRTTLTMVESHGVTPPLGDADVQFLGFGESVDTSTDTVSQTMMLKT